MSQEFDDNSRLVASRDANSNLKLYAYDALDRHITTTNADRTTQKLIWSPRSNLVLSEDANGTVVSNSYDLLDRCVRRDITPGGGVMPTMTFEIFAYDGASQLVLASNDVSMLEFSHNSLGLRERAKQDCIAALAASLLALILFAPFLVLSAEAPLILQLRPDGTNSEGLQNGGAGRVNRC